VARIGAILLEDGACTPGAIQDALAAQAVFGGRLGTNLLETGAVTEAALAVALGRRHGVKALFGELTPARSALRLIKPADADRWEVVPYLAADRKLAILTADPGNVALLDDVAFATGRSLLPFVVPEARLWQLLRSEYGLFRESRGLDALRPVKATPPKEKGTPADAGPDLMAEEDFDSMYGGLGFTTPPAGAVPPAGKPPAVTGGGEAGEQEPLEELEPVEDSLSAHDLDLLSAMTRLPAHAPPRRAPRPTLVLRPPEVEPSPLTFAEAVRFLEGVQERNAIARTVLRFTRSRFKRALLLTVRHGEAHGWAGLGEGVTAERVQRLRLPVSAPGVLKTVVEARAHFLGPLPRTEGNVRLLAALGGGVPKSAFVIPILALGKVVNVLYADNGRGQQVDPSDLGELLILATRITQGYDALTRRAV
jgi:hypothetical protein